MLEEHLPPPFDITVVADIAKVTMQDVLREMAPFYIPPGITLLLITYVPGIPTWIRRLAPGP